MQYNSSQENQDVEAKASASFFLHEYLIILDMQREWRRAIWIGTKSNYSKNKVAKNLENTGLL
jgi:hypothetical protein